MERRNIDEIVLAKVGGQELSQDELAQFDKWYAQEANRLHYESLLRVRSGVIAAEAAKVDRGKAWKRVSNHTRRLPTGWRVMRYAAAIALPVLLGTAYLVFQNRQAGMNESVIVRPGSVMAILTSSSGERLVFSETGETRIENGSGFVNVKGVDFLAGSTGTSAAENGVETVVADDNYVNFSTLEIPRGGYICYGLPDGSKVWMNNESKLRFPAAFPKGKREVELKGEAYFQVAKDENRPFIVKTGDYDIRVTGTEFNVSSYTRGTTSTTLVEGSVEIAMNGAVSKLNPGYQAVIENGAIQTREVNVGRYVAWKNNEFLYSRTPLGEIMDELARWYDIDVVWKDTDAKKYHFSAGFSRRSEIGDILEVLEKTNTVILTLKGRTLTIRDR